MTTKFSLSILVFYRILIECKRLVDCGLASEKVRNYFGSLPEF